MKADVLMTITDCHSVGVPIDDAKPLRPMGEGKLTARGRASGSIRQREWTLAECAQANGGVDRRYWYAQMYVYRLDNQVQSELVRELVLWAVVQRVIHNWPSTYTNLDGIEREFMMELLHMVLVEVREPWRFSMGPHDENPRRLQMQASKNTWQRKLSPIYETMMTEFLSWLSIGAGMANARLREEQY